MEIPPSSPEAPARRTTALGMACGVGAALCWAVGLVAARHGVNAGVSPFTIALHRYIWPALAFLPFLLTNGFKDLGGLGWTRGVALTVFGGLPLALLSYIGFLFVPLGHGGVIQPSCAALGGLILSRLVLKEPLPGRRIAGALAMVAGLCIIGAEALRTIGPHGVGGDFLFVMAGVFFAIFGMLVKLWQVPAMRAVATTSVLSLVGLPILFLKSDGLFSAGLYETVLQAIAQGLLTGFGGTYLFTRAVVLLGASRAVLFPSLVPPFTLLIGFLALGEMPSAAQLIGLTIVIIGFRLTQKV